MGKFFSKAIPALLALTLSAPLAHANNIPWKNVGWWEIFYTSSLNGCAAGTTYQDGSVFLIGLGGEGELDLEVLLLNQSWRSIVPNQNYNVQVRFDSRAPWNLTMTGVVSDGLHGLKLRNTATSNQAHRFLTEFMRKTRMTWSYAGNSLGVLRLNGSSRAFQEVIACTRAYRGAIGRNPDPFQ